MRGGVAAGGGGVLEAVRTARALVFDFDGTLVDSTPIKWRAFEACFEGFGERREEILAYCHGHHHTPRAVKFRYVYERILGLAYTAAAAEELETRFAALTTDRIIAAPERPGVTGFVARVRLRHFTALLSSTPHEILCSIVEARGWRGWFNALRGAPVDKAEWLRALRAERRLSPREFLFFGDPPVDAAAGAAGGATFVAVGDEDLPGAHAIPDFTLFADGT
jgi:sugar-phosphatase